MVTTYCMALAMVERAALDLKIVNLEMARWKLDLEV